MKVEVKREFIDKHTGKLHRVGDVFECNEDRLQEIQSVSLAFVSVVEEKKLKGKKVSE